MDRRAGGGIAVSDTSDKSHVSFEQHVCEVCCSEFDTGSILLDKSLRKTLGRTTITRKSICPKCAEKLRDFVVLIAVKRAPPEGEQKLTISFEDRTGDVAWLRREAAKRMIPGLCKEGSPDFERGVYLCDPRVIDILRSLRSGGADAT